MKTFLSDLLSNYYYYQVKLPEVRQYIVCENRNINVKRQPLGGVQEKRCSVLPADFDILIDFLSLDEQLKMPGQWSFVTGS